VHYECCALARQSGGAFAFALNFLWSLSLFQDKESDKTAIECKPITFPLKYHTQKKDHPAPTPNPSPLPTPAE
jgi:hypothetical protein